MEYYKILNFAREPFSNSPEPEFFYESPLHVDCLQKLELAIRIRRGLNVVIGDVGTGKTTLSRQLIRKFAVDDEVATHLLLDPHFSTEREFLITVAEMFGLVENGKNIVTDWQLREHIKKYLFEEAVEKSKIVVLIIDEGQKIPDFCLEILREFLNYETNEYKLLQIVIFAQKEFSGILARNQGFADRINLKYGLGPLNFKDTRAMVLFRVEQAMEQGKEIPVRFTRRAMREIYRVTGGYPRKIVKLCHQILLALIIQNRKRVDRLLVRSIAQRDTDNRTVSGISWAKAVVLTGLIVILILLVFEKGYFVNNILEEKIVASFATKRGAIRPSADKTAVPIPMESRGEQDMQQDSGKEEITTPLYGASKMPERNKPTKDTGTPSGEGRSPVDVVWKMASKKTATSPSSAPTTDGSIGYPAILGQVRVTQDTVIWHVVRDIYGVCDVRMLHRVAEVNPHINNLDKIVEGDIINFPTIPALHSATPQKNRYLIEIVNTANLEEAVGLYRYYRHEMQKVKMLPYWNDEEGLRFSVVLKRSFAEEHAARQKLIELPPDVAAQGNIIGGWKAGTVFFAGL